METNETGAAERIAEAKAAARQRRRGSENPDALRYSPILWISLLMLTGLTLSGLILWYEYRHPPPPEMVTPVGVTDDGGKQTGLPVAGSGPTTVEVYTDLSCAACRDVDAQTGPFLNQLAEADRIRLVWHPLGAAAPDAYATRAANALACASDVGKLQQYASALFANQPSAGGSLSADQLIELGGPIGLIQPSFAACVRDVKYADWVAVGDASAQQRGARAPSIFVNGRRLDQPTPEALLAAIS